MLPVLVAISAIIINVVRITFFEAREFIKNIRFARDTSGLHHSYVLPRPSVDLVRSSKAKVGDGDGGHKDKGGCCSRCCRRNDARRALSTMKDGGVRHKSVVRQIINPAFLGPGQRKPAAEQPREGVRRHVTLRNVVVPEPVAQTPTLPSGPAPRVHRPRPSLRFGDVSSPETTLAAWSFSQGFRHSCTRSNVLLRNWFQSRAWFAPLVYVLNLGYSSITTTSFGVFKCTGFPIASKYYLTLDYNVQCYTPNHIIAMTCAVIVILLAVVGIPAFFASKIYHHRHELDREIVVQRYGFLKGRSTWVAGRANLPGDGYRQASCPLGGLQEMFVYDG